MSSLLIDALRCTNRGRPPIWLMRQAGRYLPEYKSFRAGRELYEMFHDVETIVKVTLLPVDILQVDAAILFSDILTLLDGLSIRYAFHEKKGPVILDNYCQLQSSIDVEAYLPVIQAIKELKRNLKVPLLGFAGAPFTIASYLIEGQSSRDLKKTKKMLFADPDAFSALIDRITEATIVYLKCQERAGVDAIQLFDTWANALSIWEFKKFCLRPMQKILAALQVPTIVFCKGSSFFAQDLAELNPSAISLDWSCDMSTVRKIVPRHIALQGNLDPMVLYAPPERIKAEVDRLLTSMQGEPGYLFNLGHGMLPDIDVNNVKFLVDYVRNRSAASA